MILKQTAIEMFTIHKTKNGKFLRKNVDMAKKIYLQKDLVANLRNATQLPCVSGI